MVKQTEASVNQAEEARKETTITNHTMKRQQFESTFFNMVNLHHNILANMKLDKITSREVINKLFYEFKSKGTDDSRRVKIESLSQRQQEEIFTVGVNALFIEELTDKLSLMFSLGNYSEVFYEEMLERIEKEDIPDLPEFTQIFSEKAELIKRVEEGLSSYSTEILELEDNIFNSSLTSVLGTNYDFSDLIEWKREKERIYTEFYLKYEYLLGHYYRNLYRIIKYVNETDLIEEKLKQEFRGILRAQLSSFELMMLFYNVMYSEKGEKFKDQLKHKNFFDNHLMINEFIWNDDYKELEKIR